MSYVESLPSTLTVSPLPTVTYSVEIALSTTAIYLGASVTVSGTFLYIEIGAGMVGKKVELVVNDIVVTSTTTDAYGNFKFTLTPTAIGTYKIKARAYPL